MRDRKGLNARGFTLLELMVTMVVVSMVVAVAYQLFSTTSEAMYEVDSLAETTDRTRFALEMMAREVRAAGAFATPDSRMDPFAYQDASDTRNIRGLYPYVLNNARQVTELQAEWNRATFSDELIVLGAYDFPFSFEVTFPNSGVAFTEALSTNSQRGALRFLRLDPFVRDVVEVDNIGTSIENALRGPGDLYVRGRLLRVVDRNGFSQFVEVSTLDYTSGFGPTEGLRFGLDATNPLRARIGDERAGLEPGGEDDAGYEAALIDAYRYRVCRDARDARNLKLVRERLNASRLVNNEVPPTLDVCQDAEVGNASFVLEQHTIVERVVDFRVWYDCAQLGGALENAPWESGWIVPDATTLNHNCVYLDATGTPVVEGPAMARMAHIRLSVRTENERKDVPNYGFLLADGGTVNASNAPNYGQVLGTSVAPSGQGDLEPTVVSSLQTVDIDGDASTAARVVTMQIDVQLTNYINRARLMRPQQAGDEVFNGPSN